MLRIRGVIFILGQKCEGGDEEDAPLCQVLKRGTRSFVERIERLRVMSKN